jgi:hypothetical protein
MKTVVVNKSQIKAASKFVFENNKHIKNWPVVPNSWKDVRSKIHSEIDYLIRTNEFDPNESYYFYATGGYWIFLFYDSDTIDVEVLIEPDLINDDSKYKSFNVNDISTALGLAQ